MATKATGVAPEALGPTITVGEILVEIMATEVGQGFLEPVTLVGPYPSGAPAIFIDQVAKLGAGAGIVACVGADDFGEVNLRRLAADGVDVSAVSRSPTLPTGTAFVRYRPDGNRDFVFNIAHSAAGELSLGTAAEALIARAGHLHVMGSALSIPAGWSVLERALAVIKGRGGSVSFDPNLRKELMAAPGIQQRVQAVLAATDLFLPSEDEVFLAATGATAEDAARRLLESGMGEVVLKRGRLGASRMTAEGTQTSRPFVVREVDPTGAGDCFGAAYVTARRLGLPVETALDWGSAAGARNVTIRGPMEGTSTRAELETFIATAGRA